MKRFDYEWGGWGGGGVDGGYYTIMFFPRGTVISTNGGPVMSRSEKVQSGRPLNSGYACFVNKGQHCYKRSKFQG